MTGWLLARGGTKNPISSRRTAVIMMMTMSMGVRIACPVMSNATAKNNTCTIFFVMEFKV